MLDKRPLGEILSDKSCAGLQFSFCLEGTDTQIVETLEAVRQFLVSRGVRIREAIMFCGNEVAQFAAEDAAAEE